MKIGVMLPHGVWDEFRGLGPHDGWHRLRLLALLAEELGFESIWMSDHFTAVEDRPDAMVLEVFSCLGALAATTRRIRLGTLVLCAAFRNAALTAKMACSLDAISDGRLELGIGSGWKEDEFRAYGYGFPDVPNRLEILADQLEVITRMLGLGRATWQGRHAGVIDAPNSPRSVQRPRLPVLVGGNGRRVTWRLAAQYADELNLDGLLPDQVSAAMPEIAARCIEVGRDPGSLRVSVYAGPRLAAAGAARVDLIRRYANTGVSRVMLDFETQDGDPEDSLCRLARDVQEAGGLDGRPG
jgi:alkanesulfonate monooxygenase SsuD/methylene tetrahydromethanopterin reductase-like flavin-dependent oxidoreductase (luciferase family)